jgi:tetratricopeptide (TPR) repeat protein
MNRIYIQSFGLLLLLLFIGAPTFAQQKNWKQLRKEAEQYEKEGDLGRAAIYYESAFAQNSSNLELAYKAGDCYLKTRDYENAAKNLAAVKGEEGNSDYVLPGLKYAVALKQMGEYDRAAGAFRAFKSKYNGPDKKAVMDRVDMEIQGCTFAKKALESPTEGVSLTLLSPAVNSDKNDFAPIPFRNNSLYFSSDDGGTAKIYKVEGNGAKFNNRQEFEVSQAIEGAVANGSFTPDGMRFYFSQTKEEDGQQLSALYFVAKENGKWSNPVKLPNYINPEGYNSTQPWVIIQDNKEILYFASDRDGGKGGYDIWYTSRTTTSKGMNFTLPKNLGHNINTDADEFAPFYDLNKGMLFFSSNGHISAGGLDIFKSKGEKTQWEVAQNLGFPYNSPADDLHYVSSTAMGGGYITSNRASGSKVATNNDDVFFFGEERLELVVKGKIYGEDDPDQNPLADVNVQLFEWVDGSEELVEDRMLAVAEYKFSLLGNRHYLVVINADGYQQASFEMATHDIAAAETKVNDIEMLLPTRATPDPDPTGPTEDPYFVIVPEEYNSETNSFKFPDGPIDAVSGEVYEEGTKPYDAYQSMLPVADQATEGYVYWSNDGRLMPVIQDIVKNDPDPDPVTELDKTHHKPFKNDIDEEDAEDGVCYIIQVSAVRKYKPYKYTELEEGQMSDYKLSFEEIELDMTRVLVIPKDENADGTIGFKTKTEALNVLYHVLNHTRFTRAFVVRYKDGKRDGDGFRGWNEEAI